MTTFTTYRAGSATNVTYGKNNVQVIKPEIRMTDVVTAGAATGDKFTVITIPADTYVEIMDVEAVDATLGGVTRVDLGDSSSDTLFINNGATFTAGFNYTIATVGKLYTSADALNLKLTGTFTAAGVVRFVIRLTDCSRDAPARQKVYTNV